jgi:GGDEF domain-containing protein
MMTEKARIIAQQQQLIYRLAWDEAFGCHTRAGFEHVIWPEIQGRARWLVFFDIDYMKALNDKAGGYHPVDEMIKRALAVVRCSDYVAGRWMSGDEILVAITEADNRNVLDRSVPEGMVQRLQEALAVQGMSATFAIVPVRSTDLAENVEPAVQLVFEAKQARGVTR